MNACHQALNGRSELLLMRVEDLRPGQRHMAIVDNPSFPPPRAVAERENGNVEDVIEMSIEAEMVDASMEMED